MDHPFDVHASSHCKKIRLSEPYDTNERWFNAELHERTQRELNIT